MITYESALTVRRRVVEERLLRTIRVAILLGTEEYNNMMATLEEMADPRALRALREAQAGAKAGRVYTYEDVFGHRPLRESRRHR